MDVLLVGFIAGFGWTGWRSGLLHRLAGLALVALAFVVGAYLRAPLGSLINTFFKDLPPDYAELVGYTIAFPIILGVAYALTYRLLKGKAANGVSRRADQTLGAILGVVEAIIILSAVVVILDTYFGTHSSLGKTPGLGFLTQFQTSFNASTTVALLRDTTVPLVLTVLGPLLPKDISTLMPTGLPSGLPSGLPPGFPKP